MKNTFLFIICLFGMTVCLSSQTGWEAYEPDLSKDSLYQKGKDLLWVGNYQEAADYFSRAAETWEKKGLDNKEDVKKYIQCKNQEIHCLYKIKDKKKAKILVDELIPFTIQNLSDKEVVLANTMIFNAKILRNLKKPQASIAEFRKAHQMLLEINGKEHYSVATCLNFMAKHEIRYGSMEKARDYLEESAKITAGMTPPDWVENIYAYTNRASWCYEMGQLDKEIENFRIADSLAELYLPRNHPLQGSIINNLAACYNAQGYFALAKKMHLRSLEIRRTAFGNGHPNMCMTYINLNICLNHLSQRELATSYLDTAYQILKVHPNLNYLSAVYFQRSRWVDDQNEKIEWLEKSIDVLKRMKPSNSVRLATAYNNLGAIATDYGDYTQAQNFLLSSIKIYDSLSVGKAHNVYLPYFNLGNVYSEENKQEEALFYYQKALKILETIFPDKDLHRSVFLMSLGKTYMALGERSKAKEYLKSAFQLCNNRLGEDHPRTAQAAYMMGTFFQEGQQYDLAENFYKKVLNNIYTNKYSKACIALATLEIERSNDQKAKKYLNLALTHEGLIKEENSDDKTSERFINKWEAFGIYLECKTIQHQLFQQNRAKIISDESLEQGFALIDELSYQYFFQSSELKFRKKTRSFYELALQVYLEKAQSDDFDKYAKKSYWVIEKSKAALLSRAQTRRDAKDNKEVPQSLLDREKEIVFQYGKLFEEYESSQTSPEPEVVNKMLKWERSKSTLLDSLKKDYPEYFEGRYRHPVMSMEEIQKLLSTQNLALVGCFWGDSTIYWYRLSGEHPIAFKQFPISTIQKDLQNVQAVLNDVEGLDDEQSFMKDKTTFINASSNLYEKIWSDWEDDLSSFEQIVVLPDGAFCHLPFDVLLSEEVTTSIDYRQLPYLLRKHSISYEVAASRLKASLKKANKKAYAGFAPNYQLNDDDEKRTRYRELGGFTSLRENLNEVKTASALFRGDQWLGKEAKEKVFLEKASSYSIIHLAMHALTNDTIPMKSFLSFYPVVDEEEDSRLHVYEIAQMDLDNDLVVLSACKTNVGEAVKGEGVLGLARAFQLAGSPNLISSQWLVDDRSASEIMIRFFESLKEGKNTSTSLRDAKLEYLDQQSSYKAHPSFWATFSYYGQPGFRLSGQSFWSKRILWLGLLLLLIVTGGIMFLGKKS